LHTHTCTHACTHTHTHTYTHTYTHRHAHTDNHTRNHLHTHMQTQTITHAFTYTRMRTYLIQDLLCASPLLSLPGEQATVACHLHRCVCVSVCCIFASTCALFDVNLQAFIFNVNSLLNLLQNMYTTCMYVGVYVCKLLYVGTHTKWVMQGHPLCLLK